MNNIFYTGPKLADLHEQYAKQGRIDEHAPITTTSTITINAPVERVWQQLVNLAEWPTIDPNFRNVHLTSGVTPDADFRFTLRNFPIKAKFALVEPPHRLAWTGVSLWFQAVDLHILEPLTNELTRHTIQESFAGVLASVLMSRDQLRQQHEQWLHAFKRAVEVYR